MLADVEQTCAAACGCAPREGDTGRRRGPGWKAEEQGGEGEAFRGSETDLDCGAAAPLQKRHPRPQACLQALRAFLCCLLSTSTAFPLLYGDPDPSMDSEQRQSEVEDET
ncbi:uncharacterized protein A4U43_C04F33260 [Asparagus officinalis]|uniref:Uncharacterized protein n=1 Tax=Asparagus officinalis TaxID=4686 RepID=A0A5P1F667_ASPOF|nr:uncharacterized protein A4U43_C04F33260 [Asparagus officinalis]